MGDMKLSEIKIMLKNPKDGFLGFVSFVIDDSLFIGNVAIYQSANRQEGFRLVFPEKKSAVGSEVFKIVFPISEKAYQAIVEAVVEKFREVSGPILAMSEKNRNSGEEARNERQGERDTR